MSAYLPALPESTEPGEIGIEALEVAHDFERVFPQRAQPLAMRFAAVKRLVRAQRVVDFFVGGQLARIGHAGLPGGLALRRRVILDTVFGHEARGEMRDTAALVVAAAVFRHGAGPQKSWLRTSSAGRSPPPGMPMAMPPSGGGNSW